MTDDANSHRTLPWRQKDQYRWTARADGSGPDGTGAHCMVFSMTQNHDKYGPTDGWSWSFHQQGDGGKPLSSGEARNRADAQQSVMQAYLTHQADLAIG